ncbi:small nuclear ribonucleoprotein f [Diplodia corticola]|uniref:Sm protein F n=1 Tax=Diplodia corticola TaxID=236234 RepID=A0A1J9R833_9PEZI|nr:small nuclear ribonucleoprotein f [Diplodia corticola]OJD37710.1 small nuclear ribonucleoprotein f [Diplodia corticola]
MSGFMPVNPRPMLLNLVGKDIRVRLKWGYTEYTGTLISADSYMNLQLANTEEFIDGKSTGTLGQVLFRQVKRYRDERLITALTTRVAAGFQGFKTGRRFSESKLGSLGEIKEALDHGKAGPSTSCPTGTDRSCYGSRSGDTTSGTHSSDLTPTAKRQRDDCDGEEAENSVPDAKRYKVSQE